MIRIISTALIAAGALVLLVAGEGCHPNSPIENDDFKISCEINKFSGVVTLLCKSTAERWSNFPQERLNLSRFNVTIKDCGFPDDGQFRLLDPINSLGLKEIRKLMLQHLKTPLTSGLLTGISVNTLHIYQSHVITELPEQLLHGVKIQANFWATANSLEKLPANFFLNQGNLTSVDLNYNKIQTLNRTLFEPLVKLKSLSLHPNQLTKIEDGLFDRQTELEILDIGNNLLQTLPPNIFKNLKNLRMLHMGRNNFTELPYQLLHNQNENLKRFAMDENHGTMKTLPNSFLENCRKLEEVWMCSNGFTSLPDDLFFDTESLKHVDLSSNNLTVIPSKLFSSSPNLEKIKLSYNQISELPSNVFNENANLEELYLDNNQLTNLRQGVLDGLHHLKVLDVSHNLLVEMNLKICEGEVNNNLKDVTMSYNRLTQFSAFQNCVDIERIVASHNNISKIITDGLVNKSHLKTLDLASNRIKELPLSAISRIRVAYSLSSLDVSDNQITWINMKNYAEPISKLTVDVSRNPLYCDCNIYDFMNFTEKKHTTSHLKVIKSNLSCAGPPQLAGRNVETVSSSDLTCPLISNTTGDACNEVCSCFKNPGNKRLMVDCSNKKLKSVPALISKPQNWSIALNMSGNDLQITPAMNRSYLLEVVSLDLSSNNISTVTLDTFSGSLRQLQLHNNSITKLETNVIEYLKTNAQLKNLTLHQNNWNCHCDANNREFLAFVQLKLAPLQLDRIKCYGTNKLMSTMTADELCENHTAIIVGASLLIAFFSVVIGVLAALYYKYQKEIKIWLYSKQLCLRFVTENELDKDKKYDAFISFSHKDEEFVINEIINKLEEGPNPYKLCVHYRDWLAGEWITEQIARSVEESRRTIVVLSPNFLESVWGGMEFRTAHNQALKEGRARVILILYGDIGNTEDLDPELKAYLSMNTYVKWGDPWFWDKLRYALPHRNQASKTRNARIIQNHLVQMSSHANNSNGKAEIIPMPNINVATHDSVKLLDPRTEEDRTVLNC